MGFPPKDNPEGFNNGGAWEVGKWLWCVFREQLWRRTGNSGRAGAGAGAGVEESDEID